MIIQSDVTFKNVRYFLLDYFFEFYAFFSSSLPTFPEMETTMKRRHIPHVSEKQQQDYTALAGDDYIDTKEKAYNRYRPQPQAPVVYSSNKVRASITHCCCNGNVLIDLV